MMVEPPNHPNGEEPNEGFIELEETKASSKWLAATTSILLISVLATGLYYYAHSADEKALADQAKLNADRAVNVLPPGIEDAWIAYVERRVAVAIQPKAGAISVTSSPDETTLVSRNTPFKVT